LVSDLIGYFYMKSVQHACHSASFHAASIMALQHHDSDFAKAQAVDKCEAARKKLDIALMFGKDSLYNDNWWNRFWLLLVSLHSYLLWQMLKL
jgi:phosphoribosylformylglycinamidine (FGAM) synthase-like enzyme